MPTQLDARLAALAATAPSSTADLAGLEDRVWAEVQARKAASAAGSAHVRLAITVLALGAGLAFGLLHQPPRAFPGQTRVAEFGVLSEDGFLAPSVRLGGGA